MEMPLPEILDRMSIIKLKIERIGEPHLKKEYEEYKKALEEFKGKGGIIDKNWLENLYEINKKIWDFESAIRQGKEGELGLEEVGRRALAIRDLNKERISVKNEIVEKTGIGFKDIKMNHASE